MKTFVAFIGLCLVSINAYRPKDPNMALTPGNVNLEVVGGTNATAKQAPWQISLVSISSSGYRHFCGGSLLGERAVLTAAHCCAGTAKTLQVKYGGTDRTNLSDTNQVSLITMHPNYNSTTIDYDYCVLCLQDYVEAFDRESVQLISIAYSRPKGGTKADLTGWGRTTGNGTLPTKLQYVQMDICNSTECNKKWKNANPVTKNMICAQSKNASGCNGDSGGPLTVNNELVGVVSWGASGCPPDTTVSPSVFADPVTMKSWIEMKVDECW